MTKIVPATPSNPNAFDMSEAISKAAKAPPVAQHRPHGCVMPRSQFEEVMGLGAEMELRRREDMMRNKVNETFSLRRETMQRAPNPFFDESDRSAMRAPSQRPTRRDYADMRLSADELTLLCDAMNSHRGRSREHAELMNKLIVNLNEATSR